MKIIKILPFQIFAFSRQNCAKIQRWFKYDFHFWCKNSNIHKDKILMIFKNFVRYSKSKILISFRLFLQPRLIRIEFSRGLPLIINGQKLKRL